MNLQIDPQAVLHCFGRYTGLAGEPLEAQLPLCREAVLRLEARRNEKPLTPEGEELLTAAGAAMAARKHLLLCIAAGGSLTVGDARVTRGGPVEAAADLEEQALEAAAPWLRPSVIFRRMEDGHGL